MGVMVTGSLQKVLALSGALFGRCARVALRAAVARVVPANMCECVGNEIHAGNSTTLKHYRKPLTERAVHAVRHRCDNV